MATEVEDPKQVIEKLNRAFSDLREENNKGQKASAEKLTKIEADLAKYDAAAQRFVAQIESQVKIAAQLDAIEKKLNRAEIGAPADERKRKDEEQKTAFLAWCRKGDKSALTADEVKALLPSDDTAGGYLAPPEYIKEIIKAEVLISPMRGLVRVRPTSSRSIQIPKRTGVSTAAWVSDAATRVESTNPAYGLVEVPTHELTAEHYVSMQELEDSVFDLEAELSQEFSEQFAVAEGKAIVNGNGVGRPFGFLDAGQAVASTNSGSAAVIADSNGVADGLVDMVHAVKTAYAQNGRFLLNRKTTGAVRKLKDSQKRYIWEPSPAAGLPSTILGLPYTEVPDMDDEGANKFPIAFGDWKRAYTMVDRIVMSVLRDPYTKASVGQVKFVARRRIGGQVVLSEAIRLLKCST